MLSCYFISQNKQYDTDLHHPCLTLYHTTRDAACETQGACVSPSSGVWMTSNVTYERGP